MKTFFSSEFEKIAMRSIRNELYTIYHSFISGEKQSCAVNLGLKGKKPVRLWEQKVINLSQL
jgi:hypothetical protein